MKSVRLVKKYQDTCELVVILGENDKVKLYNDKGDSEGVIFGSYKYNVELRFIHSYTSDKLIYIDLYINSEYMASFDNVNEYIFKEWRR